MSIGKTLIALGFKPISDDPNGDFLLRNDGDGFGTYIARWQSGEPIPQQFSNNYFPERPTERHAEIVAQIRTWLKQRKSSFKGLTLLFDGVNHTPHRRKEAAMFAKLKGFKTYLIAGMLGAVAYLSGATPDGVADTVQTHAPELGAAVAAGVALGRALVALFGKLRADGVIS